LGDPAMMEHLGGPEGPEKIAERQAGYEKAGSGQFKIVVGATGEAVGWVGYWSRAWRDEEVYEIGWSVIPAFQGRGIAGLATRQAIAIARSERKHRFLHAFPSVGNAPSNAICRKLGFTLLEECEFEYPPGTLCSAMTGVSTSSGAASGPGKARDRAQAAFTAATRRSTDAFASPNSMAVFGR
jgi:RimJ/RimL family protein N-acetyltransferase